MLEVYHGIYLIFELALPTRNIMQLYIWWQYLRMRYMVDTTGHQKHSLQPPLCQRSHPCLSPCLLACLHTAVLITLNALISLSPQVT
jgi:hypothetical protein